MARKAHNTAAAAELKSFIERIERLVEEKEGIVEDIKEVKAEAAHRGFSVKAIERILKERRESADDRALRHEIEALTDIYRAALGMLDGTPLGEAARSRMAAPAEGEAPPDGEEGEAAAAPSAGIGPEEIAAARAAGAEACRSGRSVYDNPYTAGDPRRAAWDEGWCGEAGSDGMDIPRAWRRKDRKKPDGEAA